MIRMYTICNQCVFKQTTSPWSINSIVVLRGGGEGGVNLRGCGLQPRRKGGGGAN